MKPRPDKKLLCRGAACPRLRFFLVNFQNAHDVDIGVLERLLDIREFGVLDLQNEIRFGCHDRASQQKK